MKELRFHPHYRSMILTTAEDSFNIFRPNLDPDDEEDNDAQDQEEQKTSEVDKEIKIKASEWQNEESDEDMEAEERRVIRTAR